MTLKIEPLKQKLLNLAFLHNFKKCHDYYYKNYVYLNVRYTLRYTMTNEWSVEIHFSNLFNGDKIYNKKFLIDIYDPDKKHKQAILETHRLIQSLITGKTI